MEDSVFGREAEFDVVERFLDATERSDVPNAALVLAGAPGIGKTAIWREAVLRARQRRAGVPKLTFHDLRHSYGSHIVRQGLDPVRAARQMGHARPSITLDIYAHEFEEARGRDDIVERLTAAFGA